MDIVSIIIPVYNTEKYIGKCLESVVGQTYKKLEIIIVDDGSTDRSLDIINNYKKKDNRIKVISGKNKGVSCARNKGLEYATGTKIVFFDSDDIMDDNAIKKMLEEMNEGVDLVIGSYTLINEKDDFIREEKVCQGNITFSTDFDKNLVDLMNLNPFPGNKMYLTDIIKKSKLQWPLVSLGEDQGFFLSYLCISKNVKILTDSVFGYRVVGNSASHKVDKHILSIAKGFDYAYEFAKDKKVKKIFFDNLYNRRMENYIIQFLRYMEFKKKRDRRQVFFTLYQMIDELEEEAKDVLSENSKKLVFDVRKKYKYRVIYLSYAYYYYKKLQRIKNRKGISI